MNFSQGDHVLIVIGTLVSPATSFQVPPFTKPPCPLGVPVSCWNLTITLRPEAVELTCLQLESDGMIYSFTGSTGDKLISNSCPIRALKKTFAAAGLTISISRCAEGVALPNGSPCTPYRWTWAASTGIASCAPSSL